MIFLTGGTGFLGRQVAQRLVAAGKEVRCLVRPASDLSLLARLPVEIWRGDVTDPSSLAEGVEGCEAVIHLVAIIREKGNVTFERFNHQGTQSVVQAAQKAGCRRFIHVSAIGAGPDPSFPYLHSKWQGEEAVRKGGIPFTILRSSLMFGERDEFFTTLADIVRKPPTGVFKLLPIVPIAGAGNTKFQPIWVEDVAACIVKTLGEEGTIGKTISIGGPEHLTYEEMMDLVIRELEVRRWKVHMPLFLVRPAVAFMELIMPHPPVTSNQLEMLPLDNITDLEAVPKAFGFTPTRLGNSLEYIKKEQKRGA